MIAQKEEIVIPVIDTLAEEIKELKKVEIQIIEEIYELICQDATLLKKYEAIISIDGIGKIAAIVLIHLFIKYPNANQRDNIFSWIRSNL